MKFWSRWPCARRRASGNAGRVPIAVSALAISLSVSPGAAVASEAAAADALMPAGISIRLTLDGPIFIDKNGMTLYKMAVVEGQDKQCSNRHGTVLVPEELKSKIDAAALRPPDVKTRRTCLEKHPPLRAPDHAAPIGEWKSVLRDDGITQWAHNGQLVYTSIKDLAPGDVNGVAPPRWAVAEAPLRGMPHTVRVAQTALGIALSTTGGRTLYYQDREGMPADPVQWRPLEAPAIARGNYVPDWSILARADGSRQWAYQGKALYIYANDSARGDKVFNEIFGSLYGQRIEGWRVALLKSAAAHPREITVKWIVDFEIQQIDVQKRVYADARGKTIYVMHCLENTTDNLECDDVGDSPRYWRSYCGGDARCAKTWTPVSAPAGAKPIDNTWSVISINPHHPWTPSGAGETKLQVWAYRGRPVFTYALDTLLRDHLGDTKYCFPVGQFCARPVLASLVSTTGGAE